MNQDVQFVKAVVILSAHNMINNNDILFDSILSSDFNVLLDKIESNKKIIWKSRQINATSSILIHGLKNILKNYGCAVTIVNNYFDQQNCINLLKKFIEFNKLPIYQINQHEIFLSNKIRYYVVNSEYLPLIGNKIDFLHLDELSTWQPDKQACVINSSFPLLNKTSEVIIDSTEGIYPTDSFHNLWNYNTSNFRKIIFPWWKNKKFISDPVNFKTLTYPELEMVMVKGFSLEQIGWRRERISELGESKFFREFAENVF